MLAGPNNAWKWVKSNLDGDKSQINKSGLYFGDNAMPLKVLSMEDMMEILRKF